MKITKRQLSKLIRESLMVESAYDRIILPVHAERTDGILKPDPKHSEAIKLHNKGSEYGMGLDRTAGRMGDFDDKGTKSQTAVPPGPGETMKGISAMTGKDLRREDYFIWRGLDTYWDSGMNKLPGIGRKGDPYLYMPSSVSGGKVSKVRVVGGPVARAMGREINADLLRRTKKGKPQSPRKFLTTQPYKDTWEETGDLFMAAAKKMVTDPKEALETAYKYYAELFNLDADDVMNYLSDSA